MVTVIRVPVHNPNPTTDDPLFVLIHVEASKAVGSKPLEATSLDLKLVATENESAYTITLKQDEVQALRSKNSSVSEAEWEHVLRLVFYGEALADSQIEAVATVNDRNEKKRIDVTIRKNVEGITSRLGSIPLTLDSEEEEGIDVFEWAGGLALELQSTKHALSESKIRSDQQKETIAKLQNQIEDLTVAKSNHETDLLSKFRDLLNEKKAKIRDQQRLLASSGVDITAEPLAKSEAAPKRKGKATVSSSGKGKRKASENDAVDAELDDDGAERMDIDPEHNSDQDEDEAEQNTTEDEDEETADDDDEPPVIKSAPQKTRRAVASKASGSKRSASTKSLVEPPTTRSATEDAPPPPRKLPFQEKKRKPADISAPEDGAETASDDEL